MNNEVRKAPAEEPSVKLAVYDVSGSRLDVPSEENDGDFIVWIDASDPSPSLSFVIRMDPEMVKEMADLQYVVETSPFDGVKGGASGEPSRSKTPSHQHSRPSPTPMILTAPSPATAVTKSSFVNASNGGGILCNGRRGHARGKNGSVKYELATKTKSKQRDDSSASEDDSLLAEIVAGYSEYHGPVTLTRRVLFKRKDTQAESRTAGQGEL
eukprot:CAMPEP_0172545566 /NCGR_PEP_ID=MMETSP1067-20121228/15466_1 /TAXON_ID=265564 ORGANISM="Thalassiosira punctigera, Strain Tpunct2005C2" /NCGR_SAMPLE_ID=MMETSP1067 /ASSEMBLY_ACC=CAM_ASM_000444 /LENGTH=211 /DNA_ID=CAMNT_0013332333 /DNA_START=176 /DNA_END=814 /DNA_ORIENTATION=-